MKLQVIPGPLPYLSFCDITLPRTTFQCSVHSDGDYGLLRKVVFQTEDRQNSVDSSRDSLLRPLIETSHPTMFTSPIFTVSSLSSVPRVLPQPFRALTLRRSIQAKLSIAAMASSADVKLDRNTPEDQWKQVLSTEEASSCPCMSAFSDQFHRQHLCLCE